jgi:hypothetical protein
MVDGWGGDLPARVGARLSVKAQDFDHRHSGAMQSIEPEISRFPNVQLHN